MIKFAKIDCTVHQSVCQDQQVQGYPTLKYFNAGIAEEYNSGRTKEDLVQFAQRKYESQKPPKEVKQMLSQKDFDDYCKDE